MSLNFSLKYVLLILTSIIFIFISISGVLFSLLKFDFIYEYNLSTYPIEERTSLHEEKLRKVNLQIKDYFFNEDELLNVEIFNNKEILHMKDVKEIIKNIFFLGKISSLVLVSLIYVCILKYRIKLHTIFKFSSLTYLFFSIIMLFGFLISFNQIFIIFHELAFNNDLWLLNINEDYLLMMYPESFFRDVTIFILLGSFSVNLIAFLISKKLIN
tara:strand:+ start:41 stop:682 length:642 start_codon:yes stop_codon:yes gene_type:complete